MSRGVYSQLVPKANLTLVLTHCRNPNPYCNPCPNSNPNTNPNPNHNLNPNKF